MCEDTPGPSPPRPHTLWGLTPTPEGSTFPTHRGETEAQRRDEAELSLPHPDPHDPRARGGRPGCRRKEEGDLIVESYTPRTLLGAEGEALVPGGEVQGSEQS